MDSNPLRILLIEDDEDDYVLVRDLLQDLDHEEVAIRWETGYDGGRDALEHGHHDVCLLDFRLGARDGMELLREVNPRAIDTPVIFMTGQDSRDLDLKAMQAGAADYLVKGRIDTPILERAIRYAIHRQRLLTEIHRQSLVDELTGILNRRGFEEQAEREIKLALRRGHSFALLFADVDRFKQINDRYGHAEGDRALREVAQLLRSTFRETDIIARLGGDEFAVVPVDASPDSVHVPGRRLQTMLDRRNTTTDRPYALSLTLGLSFLDPGAPVPLWQLVADADRVMYREKLASG